MLALTTIKYQHLDLTRLPHTRGIHFPEKLSPPPLKYFFFQHVCKVVLCCWNRGNKWILGENGRKRGLKLPVFQIFDFPKKSVKIIFIRSVGGTNSTKYIPLPHNVNLVLYFVFTLSHNIVILWPSKRCNLGDGLKPSFCIFFLLY